MDENDIFYDLGHLSTATYLEPLLGICVACFPVCRPLFSGCQRKLKNAGSSALSRVVEASRLSNQSKRQSGTIGNEAVTSKGSQSMDRNNFRRLYDNGYQMTDFSGTTQCEGHGHNNPPRGLGETCGDHEIIVTETWDVAIETRV